MTKMIQIRNVPEDLHRRIKVRAASEGLSMSEWLLRQATHGLERPSKEQWLAMLRDRPRRTDLPKTAAEMIRQERDTR